MDSDKKKALELALGKIEKDFGKGSLMRLGDTPDEKNTCYTNRCIIP